MSRLGPVIVFGEVLFDRFPDGSEVLGGAPFNVAWNLRGFGADPLFISRVGDDELGERVLAEMSAFGLDTAGVQRDELRPTGTVEVEFVNGEPRYEIVSDRAWDFIEQPPATLIPDAPPLAYHGSLALRSKRSAAAAAAILASRAEAPKLVFFDVNLRDPWWNLPGLRKRLAQADYIKLNEDELRAMSSKGTNVEDAARELLEQSKANAVFITQGSRGARALYAHGGWLSTKPERELEVVDTVGAGDGFSAVLILGTLQGWPPQTTLTRAREFAEAVVGLRGATTTKTAFYDNFRQQWSNE